MSESSQPSGDVPAERDTDEAGEQSSNTAAPVCPPCQDECRDGRSDDGDDGQRQDSLDWDEAEDDREEHAPRGQDGESDEAKGRS